MAVQKKTKKMTVTKAKHEAWTQFSRYIRLRDCLQTTGTAEYGKCVTCKKTYPFNQLHAGHFVPGRTNAVLFDVRGVHAQCFVCNVRLGGNWIPYLKYMFTNYGDEVVEELIELRHKTVKYSADELLSMRDDYRHRISQLI